MCGVVGGFLLDVSESWGENDSMVDCLLSNATTFVLIL